MKALDKGCHLPVVFTLFGVFLTAMLVHDLRTGEIWRGGGHEPTITLVKDAAEFYSMIFFVSALAVTFWGGTIWTLFLLFRRKTE